MEKDAMVELDSRRKKARLQLVEPLEDDDLSCESGIYTDEPPTVAVKVGVQYPSAPRAFLCPLTLEIMFDPFVDAQGNAFERRAILKWLQTNKISPISRKPLRAGALVPNNSLRDIIHNYMGPDWVERKLRQIAAEEKNQKLTRVKSGTFRSKIDTFLEGFSECKEVGGLKLRLNEKGSAAFRYGDVIIVLDVPHSTGTFHLYTRELLENPTSPIKDRMLELNFMQGKDERALHE